jgi:uncharacterized protein
MMAKPPIWKRVRADMTATVSFCSASRSERASRSPYSSAIEVAAAHYANFPVNWLMFDRYRSDLAISEVHIPILVVHGDEDDVVPINLARRLFALANEPKTFMLISGGKHLVLGLAEVFPRVRKWIDEQTGVARRYGDPRE